MAQQNKPSPKNEEQFNQIIQKVKTGQPLSESELTFINNYNIHPQGKQQISVIDKRNKGEKLTSQEQLFLKELEKQQEELERQQEEQAKGGNKLPLSQESHENLNIFKKEKEKNKGGYEINHITDIHQKAESFEHILFSNLYKSGHLEQNKKGQVVYQGQNFKLKKNVPIVITGDIGVDYIDQQNQGFEAFLADALAIKSNWTKEEEKEFRKHYKYLMEKAGLTEEMIKEKNPTAFSDQGAFQIFYSYLFGIQDPHFLTNKEKKHFKNTRGKVQNLIKKGMKHHAKTEYTIIKKAFDKLNLTSNQVAIVSGNHDLPEIMKEVLGDYLITPGQTRKVSGIKFGNIIDSANGNFTQGPDFNDIFGYAGLREELEQIRYESKPFKDIKNILNKDLNLNMDNRTIKKYMDISIQRAAQGIGTGHLGNYFKKEIEPILQEHTKTRLASIKNNIPKDADIILQHSMIDNPQTSGIEEMAAHELLSKQMPEAIVLHGHEHGATPHQKDNIYHLNPGSTGGGNSAVHLLDKNKQYKSSLFKGTDETMQSTYRYLNKELIPGHPSQRFKE